MVRLRVRTCHCKICGILYFNSNMVRLRDYRALYVVGDLPTFQFQHGTIERHHHNPKRRCDGRISIPTWYDWECAWNYRKLHWPLFQFQHGTIESSRCNEAVRRCGISIPTWYDWEILSWLRDVFILHYFNSNMVRLRAAMQLLYPRLLVPFQFQHGTIERSWKTRSVCWERHFNSNMVRLRVQTDAKGGPERPISIPTWYDWE